MSNLYALFEAIRNGNEQETKSILEKNAEFVKMGNAFSSTLSRIA